MTTIQLRDYQDDLIARTRSAMRKARRVLIQAPTGAGKTAIASFIVAETVARGQGAWFICHRQELVDGTSRTFKKYGIAHGFIASGQPMNLRALAQICSIDTLKNRLATMVPPKVAIIDECHHANAAGWALVIAWLVANGCWVLGLSATPKRLDGQPLNDHFDTIVLGPTAAWLMERGYLSRYEIFAPDIPNMKGVRKSMGDYSKKETAEKMDKPKLTGNIIKHWRAKAEGMRTIGFGVNVLHSQHLAESFCQAGIRAAHLDGSTEKRQRSRIIGQYADGELEVLFNTQLFDEGFDLASIAGRDDVTIDALIDAGPSQSEGKVRQRWGRVLRPKDYPAIILDHAGNCMRHGFPDDDVEWSLDGTEKGKAANDNAPPPPVVCESCFNAVRQPIPDLCPHCQARLRKEAKPIEEADGELKKLGEDDKARIRKERAREQAECKTLDELVKLGHQRGYASPMGWAQKVFGGRRRA